MSVQAWESSLPLGQDLARFTAMGGTGYLFLITIADNEGLTGRRAYKGEP